MTDTGQVPGEGLPEGAGTVDQPGVVPAPGAYTYLDPAAAPAEDDDLLFMPGAQGAWTEGQPGYAPEAAGYEQAPAAAESIPYEQAPQGVGGLQPEQVPGAPTAGQGVPQDAQYEAAVAQQTPAQPAQAAQQAAAQQAVGQEAIGQEAVAHVPGAHEMSGRDSGSVNLSDVRLPGPAEAQQHAGTHAVAHAGTHAGTHGGQQPVAAAQAHGNGRRPLHMGPPTPAAASPVRSLADRGPATTPPQPMQVQAQAQMPDSGQTLAGPEYLDVPRAENGVPQGQQLGEIPLQGAVPWSPQPPQAQYESGAPQPVPGTESQVGPAHGAETVVPDGPQNSGVPGATPGSPEGAAGELPAEAVESAAPQGPAASGELPAEAQPVGQFVPVEGVIPSTPHLAPTPPQPLRIPQEEVAAPEQGPAAEQQEPEAEQGGPVDQAVAEQPVGEQPVAEQPVAAAAEQPAEADDEAVVVPAPRDGESAQPAAAATPQHVHEAEAETEIKTQPATEPEAAAEAPGEGDPTAAETPEQTAPEQAAAADQPAPEPETAPETAPEPEAEAQPEAVEAQAEAEAPAEPAEPAQAEPEAAQLPQSEPQSEAEQAPVPAQPTGATDVEATEATEATDINDLVEVTEADAPQAPVQPEAVRPEAVQAETVPADAAQAEAVQPEPAAAAPEAAQADDAAVAEPAEQPRLAPEARPTAEPSAEQSEASGEAPADVPAAPPAPAYDEAEREAVLRVMRERRDIRNGFRNDPIPHEVLLRVLEAAHTAPSVGHSQPWDFVVIRSAETRRTMHELAMRQREAYAKSLPKGRAKQFKELKIEAILDTPVNIVVTADPTRGGRHTLGRHTQPQMAPYSSALAVENLWLAARAEGLGVGWVSFFDEREMVRTLELPEHLEVVAYLCVGYVDEFPDEPELMQAGWSKRRPLSWVVHEETYGRRALPGEEPHDLLAETVANIRPLDAKALGEAWERQKRMTKPAGALGMLEIISAQLSGLSRMCPPPIPEPAAVAIFAGDHGVHAQGVTPWPQEVTGQMVANFLGGGAVCNAFANQVGAEVCIIDVGVASDLPATPGLLPRKVRAGTADMTTGPALTREEVKEAIEVGIDTARDLVAAGNKALLTGEMGIANTTASAALISVFTGVDPAEVTGRGTGINDETLARKTDVVRRALELHQPDPADPIGVLAAIGGLEHAAMVGLLLGGASLRTPVILDGVSAGAAALVARAIAPEVLAACIAGHRSAEPGHVAALNKLGLRPLVDLDLRLGEGTGALLALPVVQSAARAMHEVATFDSAGVTEK
ncbi:nicotinate-nucleotide--dimethylbenzimidazole phosphoribosyltransferase [Streptomyces sp. Da 82-17]|uniref:nicotinate-nucleotide--dimethylbenzimidazole phosphoribosyltransferase n=1 Tax=Streptomyces sp. Da 82-17 TaxID=3377116 RepID=UPI0038D419B6